MITITDKRPSEKTMNYRVPESFHRRWKLFAFSKGISMKSAMLEAMEEYFEKHEGAELAQK